MRIGEVITRTHKDINSDKTKLHIHNTLTRAEKNNTSPLNKNYLK